MAVRELHAGHRHLRREPEAPQLWDQTVAKLNLACPFELAVTQSSKAGKRSSSPIMKDPQAEAVLVPMSNIAIEAIDDLRFAASPAHVPHVLGVLLQSAYVVEVAHGHPLSEEPRGNERGYTAQFRDHHAPSLQSS